MLGHTIMGFLLSVARAVHSSLPRGLQLDDQTRTTARQWIEDVEKEVSEVGKILSSKRSFRPPENKED